MSPVLTLEHNPVSEADFLALPRDGRRYNLIEGTLIVSPGTRFDHGRYTDNLYASLSPFVRTHRLGCLAPPDVAYRLTDDTIVMPDISFMSTPRLARIDPAAPGFATVAPDLAVEILSPGNRPVAIREKMDVMFAAGTRLIWIVHPADRSVAIYRRPEPPDAVLGEADLLDGQDVLPGFSMPVKDIFILW